MWILELPQLDENQTEATLQEWRVAEGAAVAAGQPLCLVVTTKTSVELPAPEAGVVRRLFAAEKSSLPTGYILCAGGTAEEPISEKHAHRNAELLAAHRAALLGAPASGSNTAAGAASPAKSVLSPSPAAAPGAPLRATPSARRLARELGVDLAAVRAEFPGDTPLTDKQVKRFLESKS